MSEDVLSDAFFDARERDLKKRLKPKRFEHARGVSKTAASLAETYGVDVRKARLAGLLHDWDKEYGDDEIRERARALGVDVDPYVLDTMPRLLHGQQRIERHGRHHFDPLGKFRPDKPSPSLGIIHFVEQQNTLARLRNQGGKFIEITTVESGQPRIRKIGIPRLRMIVLQHLQQQRTATAAADTADQQRLIGQVRHRRKYCARHSGNPIVEVFTLPGYDPGQGRLRYHHRKEWFCCKNTIL